MRVRIDLEPGETIEEAEEKLAKAILTKQELREELAERYDDPVLNEFHDHVTNEHLKVLDNIRALVSQEIQHLINKKF